MQIKTQRSGMVKLSNEKYTLVRAKMCDRFTFGKSIIVQGYINIGHGSYKKSVDATFSFNILLCSKRGKVSGISKSFVVDIDGR